MSRCCAALNGSAGMILLEEFFHYLNWDGFARAASDSLEDSEIGTVASWRISESIRIRTRVANGAEQATSSSHHSVHYYTLPLKLFSIRNADHLEHRMQYRATRGGNIVCSCSTGPRTRSRSLQSLRTITEHMEDSRSLRFRLPEGGMRAFGSM